MAKDHESWLFARLSYIHTTLFMMSVSRLLLAIRYARTARLACIGRFCSGISSEHPTMMKSETMYRNSFFMIINIVWLFQI